MLDVVAGELDADLFEARLTEGRELLDGGDAEAASGVLRDALGLWRGPALAQVAFEDFAHPEIRRLDELHLAALEARVEADLALGRHATVIGELRARVAEHPARERLYGQLMLALYRCGRQSDALDAYQQLSTHLTGELGLSPGPALQALQRAVLEQAAWLDGEVAAAARSSSDPGTAAPEAFPLPPAVAPAERGTVRGSRRAKRAARRRLRARGRRRAAAGRAVRRARDRQDAACDRARARRARSRRGRALRALRRGAAAGLPAVRRGAAPLRAPLPRAPARKPRQAHQRRAAPGGPRAGRARSGAQPAARRRRRRCASPAVRSARRVSERNGAASSRPCWCSTTCSGRTTRPCCC